MYNSSFLFCQFQFFNKYWLNKIALKVRISKSSQDKNAIRSFHLNHACPAHNPQFYYLSDLCSRSPLPLSSSTKSWRGLCFTQTQLSNQINQWNNLFLECLHCCWLITINDTIQCLAIIFAISTQGKNTALYDMTWHNILQLWPVFSQNILRNWQNAITHLGSFHFRRTFWLKFRRFFWKLTYFQLDFCIHKILFILIQNSSQFDNERDDECDHNKNKLLSHIGWPLHRCARRLIPFCQQK